MMDRWYFYVVSSEMTVKTQINTEVNLVALWGKAEERVGMIPLGILAILQE